MSNQYVAAMGGMPRIRPRGANAPAGLLSVVLIGLGALAIEQAAQNLMPPMTPPSSCCVRARRGGGASAWPPAGSQPAPASRSRSARSRRV